MALLMLATAVSAQDAVTLIYGSNSDPVQLDSAVVTDGESFRVITAGCEGLTAFEQGSTTPVPSLATEWTANEDATVWTFTLREGVSFHDGTPFNAEAVKFNFDRWRFTDNPFHFPEQVYEYYQYMWGGFDDASLITNVEATGEFEVTFTLSAPLAPILNNLAMSMFSIHSPTAIQEHGPDYGTPNVGYVCTGPYSFVEWIPEESVTVTRNADWWGDYTGNVEQVIFRPVPDNAARFAALQNGEVHIADSLSRDDVTAAEANDELVVAPLDSNSTFYLAFNYRIQEFNDVRVRQAISMALDKEAIVEAFYAYGQKADTFQPPFLWAYNEAIETTYDPEGAKALLAEAGFPDGLSEVTLDDGSKIPLVLYYAPIARGYLPEPQRQAEAQAQMLAEAGIIVELQSAGDWATYLDERANGNLIGIYQLGWGGDNGDPDNFIGYFFADGPKPEEGFYDNAELRDLLVAARSETDFETRKQMYFDAEQMMYDDMARVFVAHAQGTVVYRAEVQGYDPQTLASNPYWNVTLGG
jgi:peptide/nickel transport system substrate-binding protein